MSQAVQGSRSALGKVAAALITAVLTAGIGLRLGLPVPSNTALGIELGIMVGFVSFGLIGALLVARRPDHPLSWLLAATGVLAAVGVAAQTYADYALGVRQEPLPGALFAAWVTQWYWYPSLMFVVAYIPLLFPTGRPLSHRWRLLIWIMSAALAGAIVVAMLDPVMEGQDIGYRVANPFGVEGLGDVETGALGGTLFAFAAAGVLAAPVATVIRFRRSQGIERQQLKWFVAAVGLLATSIVLTEVADSFLADMLFNIAFALLPVAIAVAILRYRLYEIDRIISRTVSYGLLTAILVAVYAALVVVLQRLLAPVTGQSDLAVAASTLAVAALFGPLRSRIQTRVDRRFNRERYDAARVVDAFNARLREEIDLDELAADLLATAGASVQPRSMSLWLAER